MRDTTHMEHVERWAKFVKENPTKWQKPHSDFINSQYDLALNAIQRILKMPNGKEKIKKIYKINNLKGYSFLN